RKSISPGAGITPRCCSATMTAQHSTRRTLRRRTRLWGVRRSAVSKLAWIRFPRTELIGSAGLSTERDGEGPRHLPLLPLLVRSTDEVGGLFGGELRSGLQDLAHPRESGPEVGHQEGTYLASPAADRHRQLPPRNARESGLPEVAVQRVEDDSGRIEPERS